MRRTELATHPNLNSSVRGEGSCERRVVKFQKADQARNLREGRVKQVHDVHGKKVFSMTWLHHYHVVGRMVPGKGGSSSEEDTAVYRMRIFAPNQVVAKSRFWYFLRKLKRVKRANGEILEVNEIHEKDITTVKIYSVWLRYKSRSDTVNMCKEYRDVSVTGAVEQMYMEMSGRHRARWSSIQVLRVQQISTDEVRRPNTLQFTADDLKFPMPHIRPRASEKSKRPTYLASRPNTVVSN